MSSREPYAPGAASGAEVRKDGEKWTLAGHAIGRIVGPDAMKVSGWQRLNAEYAKQLGVEPAAWPAGPRT